MTYSLVAFDPDTGEHGVAVQSHWFSVGSLVTYAEPGVGAVATQANVREEYGPHGLALMRSGRSAAEALAELLGADPIGQERQVAMIDDRGGVAAHTGTGCMGFAGQRVGEHHSAQANLMASERVWRAMSATFEEGSGPLAARLLDALDAGEAAGGDLRGRQSAAILVVPPSGEAWERVLDVRVDDHPEPLVELRRLVVMQAAYAIAGEGDELVGLGDTDAAAAKYLEAWKRCPEAIELRYWAGLALVHRGQEERGAALLREAIASHEGWATLLAMMDGTDTPAVDRARVLLDVADASGAPR